MKRVKFLKKGMRAVHGNARASQFFHRVGDEMDLDDATADAAIGSGAAELVEIVEDEPEVKPQEDDEAETQEDDEAEATETRRQRRAREKAEREAEERGDSPLE